MDTTGTAEPSLGRALGAVAETVVDQARDLAVAQLDRWADRLHDHLTATPAQPASTTQGTLAPLIIGALAGAAVAWWLVHHREEH